MNRTIRVPAGARLVTISTGVSSRVKGSTPTVTPSRVELEPPKPQEYLDLIPYILSRDLGPYEKLLEWLGEEHPMTLPLKRYLTIIGQPGAVRGLAVAYGCSYPLNTHALDSDRDMYFKIKRLIKMELRHIDVEVSIGEAVKMTPSQFYELAGKSANYYGRMDYIADTYYNK